MTLPELITTMAILGIVMTGILGVSISGLRATTDLNQRFQAQQDGRVALTKMRNDVETACTAVVVKLNGSVVAAGTAGASWNPSPARNACSSSAYTVSTMRWNSSPSLASLLTS